MLPKNISPEKFLSEYWQKKPLFIKNAFQTLRIPLARKSSLAWLVKEVESRLVFNEEDTWRLQNGPFIEEDFTSCQMKIGVYLYKLLINGYHR